MWPEIVARLHLTPANDVGIGGGLLAMVLTCLFCWIRGDKADRIGSAVFAVCWIGGLAVEMTYMWIRVAGRPPLWSDVAWDTGLGLTFLWLALRTNNLWFVAVALFQGVQFALVAADQAIQEPTGTFLAFVLILPINLLNLAMMAAMIGSALDPSRRRSATARRT